MNNLTKEQFLKDVSRHQMEVLKHDGEYAHLRFSRPMDCNKYFDLIGWPHYTCITGDMGTYVFAKPFGFFLPYEGDNEINPGYWSEKAKALCRRGVVEEFDIDDFHEEMYDMLYHSPEGLSEDAARAKYPEIFEANDEQEAFHAMRECNLDPIEYFPGYVFTYPYLWCCYAVQWGVEQFMPERVKK